MPSCFIKNKSSEADENTREKQYSTISPETGGGITNGQVKAAVLELSVLLTQSTFLAKTMDTTVCARAFLQEKLPSQLRSIEARIETRAPSQT